MIDTCQAASMYQQFYSPNILAVASSLVGEDSLSHHIDTSIGVYIIDRYTYHALEFLERVTRWTGELVGGELRGRNMEVSGERHVGDGSMETGSRRAGGGQGR